jgi:chromosome segregation ATPase
MAGHNEIDLRHPIGDLSAVQASLQFITVQIGNQFDAIKELSRKQDDHYETLRKRIHDVVNDYDRALQAGINSTMDEIEAVEERVNTLEKEVVGIRKDIDHAAETRASNYQNLMGKMSTIQKELNDHMDEETSGIRKVLIWAALTAATGFIGLIIYIWETRQVIP